MKPWKLQGHGPSQYIKGNNAVNSRQEPNRMEPNESMNRSPHEPQRNRTGTNRFAVHKVIFEPMRIDANHGNPVYMYMYMIVYVYTYIDMDASKHKTVYI